MYSSKLGMETLMYPFSSNPRKYDFVQVWFRKIFFVQKLSLVKIVFLGFNQVVKESKIKADQALERVPAIEGSIFEAEERTSEARDALSGAENGAKDALRIAQEAEDMAQAASDVSFTVY